jgi:hypothetical protein
MISKKKFQVFEKVKKSGLAKMYDIDSVRLVAIKYGQILTNKDCFDLILNYDKLKEKYDKKNR